jgi:2-amino-4-hydroxy-6-hydroxymethyldihydropteridine diphosphokinase
MTESIIAYIALGSNLGDRRGAIDAATQALDGTPGITVRAISTIRETEPQGITEQGRFLNAVVSIATDLDARPLLERCLEIERAQGRDRSRERRWGPRRLDLDLLLYGEAVIDEDSLTVPHPRMHERKFVLEPLAELAPEAVHPVLGRTIESLLGELRRGSRADSAHNVPVSAERGDRNGRLAR